MWRGAALLVALPLVVACGTNPRTQVWAPSTEVVSATDLARPEARFTHVEGGAPGAWTPNQVIGTHLPVSCPYGPCYQPGIVVNGAAISRSPATSGAQVVLLTTYVYKEDRVFGGWFVEIDEVQRLTIPAGAPAVVFGNRQWLPNTGGAKTVSFTVVWGDERDQALGWQIVGMNQRGDYVCQTKFTWACSVHDGFVTVTQPS